MEKNVQTIKKGRIYTKIDELGRIHLQKELRKDLKIQEGDKLYVYRSGINIILEKSNIKVEKEKIFEEQAIINNEMEIRLEISKIKNTILSDKKGILRTIDELGRCIIPIDIRKELNITQSDIFKICKKDNKIILVKERRIA